jgi:hypothetical protein
MTYGIAGTWTDHQGRINQVAQLKVAKCVVIFRNKFRDANAERRRFTRLQAKRSDRNVMVITAVDRLSGDRTDLTAIARGRCPGACPAEDDDIAFRHAGRSHQTRTPPHRKATQLIPTQRLGDG